MWKHRNDCMMIKILDINGFRLDHATPEDDNLIQSVVNEEEERPVKPGCTYKDKYSLTIFTHSNQW